MQQLHQDLGSSMQELSSITLWLCLCSEMLVALVKGVQRQIGQTGELFVRFRSLITREVCRGAAAAVQTVAGAAICTNRCRRGAHIPGHDADNRLDSRVQQLGHFGRDDGGEGNENGPAAGAKAGRDPADF